MTTLDLPLPDPLRRFVEEEATKAGTSSVDYVQSLIRIEQDRAVRKRGLEQQLLAGLDSGDPIPADDAYWDRKQTRLTEQYRARQ